MLHYTLFAIMAAGAIYLTYLPKFLSSKAKPPKTQIVSRDFLYGYKQNNGVIRAMQRAGANNKDISRLAKAAMLGSSSISVEDKTDSEFKQFVAILQNGIRSGADISEDIKLLNSRIEDAGGVERMVKEKTEGMHAVSQLGIAFFFPMFAGISLSIMQNALGILASNPVSTAFSFSVIVYIALILFISASFSSPSSRLPSRLHSIIPVLTASMSIFTLSSYLSNIF